MSATIENPILNAPFVVPARHWRITDDYAGHDPGITPQERASIDSTSDSAAETSAITESPAP